MTDWTRPSEFVRVASEWVPLVGERWLCDKGKGLEYRQVEREDSVILLPVQADHVLGGAPTFRPGVGRATLDFPSCGLPQGRTRDDIVPILLAWELAITANAITRIDPLNSKKSNINSFLSSQGLWAFVAEIEESFSSPEGLIGARAKTDSAGLAQLKGNLDRLQCRSALLEWQQHGS